MAYLDRLRDCRYTTPSGTTFLLHFTDLKRSGGKKAAVHEFPQSDTPEIQDLGNKGQTFPLQVYIDGGDYDLIADAFVTGLSESGPGTLKHPRWGDMLAMPITWSQSDGFVDGMGRSTFEIEFARADTTQYPTSASAIGLMLEDSIQEASDNASTLWLTDPWSAISPSEADLSTAKDSIVGGTVTLVDRIKAFASRVSDIATEIGNRAAAIAAEIDTAIIAEPRQFVTDVISLYTAGSAVNTAIRDKIKGYKETLDAAIKTGTDTAAQALALYLQYFGISAGAAASTLTGDLNDRSDTVAAAEAIQDLSDELIAGIEAAEDATDYAANAAMVSAIKAMLAAAAALLLQKSFTLRAARHLVLSKDCTPLDLVYDLLKPDSGDALDAALDDFIAQNALGGDLLLLIPAGTEVAYYAR